MKKRFNAGEQMTIMDAVDNLSSMAEVDIESDAEGLERGVKNKLKNFKHLKEKAKAETLQTVKGTFKTIHKYLEHVYKKDKNHLQDIEMQRGLKAIMVLAGEAADKLGSCASIFEHAHKGAKGGDLKEYKSLKSFYLNKIVKRFQTSLVSEESWEEKWGENDSKTTDIERLSLKDLETVKRDRCYELFLIRKEGGEPLFNRNLLRHIRLVSDFDQIISPEAGEDPLLRVNVFADRRAQHLANAMRKAAQIEIAHFYVDALHYRDISLVQMMDKVTMSLLLASHPANLIQDKKGKTCVRYLHDFQSFLREILISPDYHRVMSHSLKEADKLSRSLVLLVHVYCFAFFTYVDHQSDLIRYIRDLVKQGCGGQELVRGKVSDPLTFWSDLLDTHDALSAVLKKYPSGPFFKTLDVFRERNEKEGFDPIYQGNVPAYQFTFSNRFFKAKCLKLPCPTHQNRIGKAQVIEEFKGYLSYLDHKGVGRHLLFNFQDRTSWEERARCKALEGLTQQTEYASQFVLVTLSKQNNFYFQTDNYRKINRATEFLHLIKEQICARDGCGFFVAQHISRNALDLFIEKVLCLIHKWVFGAQKNLSRRERLDFIEIFYQLLILKVLDLVKPAFFSFTCKDAVDIGPINTVGFYSILKMMGKNRVYDKEEQDRLLWMLYAPSLVVRERLIDEQRLSRMMSAMSSLYKGFIRDRKGFLKELQALYGDPSPLEGIELNIQVS